MDDKMTNDLRSIVGASDLEQALAGVGSLAALLGDFYAAQIDNKIPEGLAAMLTIEFMKTMLSNARKGD